jgi:hypothetical protein
LPKKRNFRLERDDWNQPLVVDGIAEEKANDVFLYLIVSPFEWINIWFGDDRAAEVEAGRLAEEEAARKASEEEAARKAEEEEAAILASEEAEAVEDANDFGEDW